MGNFLNVSPESQDSDLVTKVTEHIGTDAYRHGTNGSSVISARAELVRFVGRITGGYNKAQKLKNPEWKNISRNEMFRAITQGTKSGLKLEVSPADTYDFGRKLSRVVGCTSMLNLDAIQASTMILAEDYCKDNPYLSFDDLKPEDILETLEAQAQA
jgi:hypothetical protein